MILFIKIIIALGLIAFPIVKEVYKGKIDVAFYWGVVFGFHYDKSYFRAKFKDGDEKNFKLHILQFHILCMTVLLTFTRPADDVILEEDES